MSTFYGVAYGLLSGHALAYDKALGIGKTNSNKHRPLLAIDYHTHQKLL